MKGSILLVAIVVAIFNGAQSVSHGEGCSELEFCDHAAGLICGADNKCECPSKESDYLDGDLVWKLKWETDRCVAEADSPCVGTDSHPVPNAPAVRSVVCESGFSCQQLPNHPPSVGSCISDDLIATTPGESDDSGASQVTAVLALVLAVLLIPRFF